MRFFITILAVVYFNNVLSQQKTTTNSSLKNKIELSIGIKAEATSALVNFLLSLLNSCNDVDNDCHEEDENDVDYISQIFGGESKIGVHIEHLLVSGGYDILNFPKAIYGEEIFASTVFLESQLNLSPDHHKTSYLFGQIGKTSFSIKEIIPHWRYTMGIGYKKAHFGLDLGYNFYNRPKEQLQEFLISDDEVFVVEESFLHSGLVTLRLTFLLF